MTPTEFRALRKSMTLTQADLAACMGVTNDTISAIEVGRKGDPIPALYDLAMRWLGGGG